MQRGLGLSSHHPGAGMGLWQMRGGPEPGVGGTCALPAASAAACAGLGRSRCPPAPSAPSPFQLQAAGGDMALVPRPVMCTASLLLYVGRRTGHSTVCLFKEPASALVDVPAVLLVCSVCLHSVFVTLLPLPASGFPGISRPRSGSQVVDRRASSCLHKAPWFRGQSHPERASRNHPE